MAEVYPESITETGSILKIELDPSGIFPKPPDQSSQNPLKIEALITGVHQDPHGGVREYEILGLPSLNTPAENQTLVDPDASAVRICLRGPASEDQAKIIDICRFLLTDLPIPDGKSDNPDDSSDA